MQQIIKILVVDDDPHIVELVKVYAEREGFQVVTVDHGDQVLAAFNQEQPDVIVLDIMLPGRDGISLCRDLRDIRMVPIIMLTAKGEEADRVLGLEMGADDYVAKPFSPRELMARIKAVLRRTKVSEAAGEAAVKYPGLAINPMTRKVMVNDVDINVTPKEFDLLYYLSQNPLRVFSRESLLTAVWGYDYFGDQRTVDVHIRRLRQKLSSLDHDYLTTIWGVGYRFSPTAADKEGSHGQGGK